MPNPPPSDPRRAAVTRIVQQVAQVQRPPGQPRPQQPEAESFAPRGNREEEAAQQQLGYVPSFAEDPRQVAQAYQLIKTGQTPDWLKGQEKQVYEAFRYHQQLNGNKPYTEWKYLQSADPRRGFLGTLELKGPQPKPPAAGIATMQDAMSGNANWSDVEVSQRKRVLSDPNFYASGAIMKYPKWMQQQILADPAFDWQKLPKWQKVYYELSSSPAGMGAAQGLVMGAGNPGGALLGAGLGWAAAKSGYTPLKEPWQQKGVAAQAFGYLNFLAEQAEKVAGIPLQVAAVSLDKNPNTNIGDVFTKEGWNAGAITGEWVGNMVEDVPRIYKESWELHEKGMPLNEAIATVLNEREASGYHVQLLGSSVATPSGNGFFFEPFNRAREEIKKGRPYREVMLDMQNSISAQLGDMAVQGVADPLNVMGEAEAGVGRKIAEATGHPVAAESFRGVSGPMEAARKYKTLIQTGQAMVIEPKFRVDTMGAFARFVAGINERGEIRAGPFTRAGMLETPKAQPRKNLLGFVQEMATLTPQSRAQIGAGMFYENIGALLTRFEDPHEAGKYLKALANSDMETWRELGSRFADSPEFYTVLPALKAYNAESLDGIIRAWDTSAPNREALTRIANVLGDNPAKLLDDLASRGTEAQDFQRIVQRLQQSNAPEARPILDDIQAGRFTPDSLRQIVEAFTGEGAMPWHPGQWKAMVLDSLGSHFDEWVTERLALDKTPEAKNAFFRTANLMKTAQSILLLGGSPGYAITNGLSNMVHRAASGVFGYLTPGQINGWMERFGVNPARFEEGVGIGGMVEHETSKTAVHLEAQQKAVRGTGALADAKSKLAALSRGMPFSKLSSWFEKTEGKQAYAIAMRDFWSQSWRRGVGFRKMDPGLARVIQDMGVDPNHIYAAIEAGMNQGEIEKVLSGRYEGVQSRTLIDNAARQTGLTSQQAALMLERVGVLDALDSYLKGQTTRDGVTSAFRRAERVAQDTLDMRTGEDLKALAEHVRQKVTLEQPHAAFEVFQKANAAYTDTWLDHYFRFGELMEDLKSIDDPSFRSHAIDFAYDVSDGEFRRVNSRSAANYKGIFDGLGVAEEPNAWMALQDMGVVDRVMHKAYDTMRQEHRDYLERYKNDWNNQRRFDDWNAMKDRIDAEFENAFSNKHGAEVRIGKSIGGIFDNLYGPAAGEAARLWWEDVVKFNDEIVARERKAREGFARMPKEQREAAKQKYYRETKVQLIAEAQKINDEGIARLERVVKRGGGREGTLPPEPTQPTPTPSQPTPPPAAPTTPRRVNPAEEINSLIAGAEQRNARTTAENAQRVQSVWEIAEEYPREGLPYDHTILQDRFALLGALRKEEYGGIPDLKGLSDERLTPELVRRVMDERQKIKEAQAAQQVSIAAIKAEEAASTVRAPKIDDNTNILKAVSEHGGIDLKLSRDLTGEKRPKTMPGVFTRKGINIDEMARRLADDGYPIRLDDPNDPGGIRQATELINRARRGDPVYPMGHDHEAALARAQEEAAVQAYGEAMQPEPFDLQGWKRDFDKAVQAGDLTGLYERIGELPEELTSQRTETGETWNDYMSRIADETAARVEADARNQEIAEALARNDDAMQASQDRADHAMTRQLLKEKFQEVFNLTDQQATAYMELSDAIAGWYARATGESGEQFYARYYEDAVPGFGKGEGAFQEALSGEREYILSGNPDDVLLYNSATGDVMGRFASEDLARVHAAEQHYNPKTLEYPTVKDYNSALGNVRAKGGVTFDADGIKGTIHAFEAKDFTTLIHENAHVFRRMLKDVAERTGNKQIVADLATIEEWAGVKDGNWSRQHEEKFARGWERYITEGKAPTPKLARAFESFKSWMLEIYRTITGSQIDVKLTDDVRKVFDRMLGDEDAWGQYVESNAGNRLRDWGTGVPETVASRGNEMVWYGPDGRAQGLMELSERGIADLIVSSRVADTRAVIEQLVTVANRATDIPTEKLWEQVDQINIKQPLYQKKSSFDISLNQSRRTQQVDEIANSDFFRRVQEYKQRLKEPTTLYQRGPKPQQPGLWGAGEDMPLFSGTPETVRMEEFNPQPVQRQEALFDTGQYVEQPKPAERAPKQIPGQGDLFQRAEPTNTPEFRNWFGDSKVVDKSGEPMVVYHGTDKTFNEFDPLRAGTQEVGWYGKGLYFTADQEAAGAYATRGGEEVRGAQVMPVYISMKKPFYWPDGMKAATTPEESATITRGLIEMGYDGVIVKNKYAEPGQTSDFYEVVVFKPEQVKSVANRGTFDANNPNILFQDASLPAGALDQASQFMPHSEGADQDWSQFVRPLLAAMQDGALRQIEEKPLEGAFRDMSPEGQAQLRRYLKGVQNDMATTKLSTMRYGEQQRDFALLNYNKQYGFDRHLQVVAPYELFYTRAFATWGARAIDGPAWFSNYARAKMQQQRYERDIPERLRNKIKIPAPWMPDWMGDAFYIDPMSTLFTPSNFLRPFERMEQDKSYQEIEAERILQEWSEDGSVSQSDLQQAAQTRSGPTWERAFAEAQQRREAEIANPMDFFSTIFGPAWYLSAPLNAAGIAVPGISKGDPNKIGTLPLTNTARALDTVTQGTWAEPVGDVIGLLGKPEEWVRKKAGLPSMGEYGEYYTKRQIANMVTERLITSEDAETAMIEKQGPIWDQATERVRLELAMRVPTMGALYAGLHEGPKAAAQAALPSLFGSGLLPAGELKYRGLKAEWDEAWKKADAGDTQAVSNFFDEHPEYESYLAKNKSDPELLKSFLIGQIWDGYMALGPTNRKQATAEMGDEFQQAFLDKETRSYESIDTDTLIQWAQMLKKKIPQAVNGQPLNAPAAPELNLYDEDVTKISDEYFQQRTKYHPDYYRLQAGYYALPTSQRAGYLVRNPELKAYWDWKKRWEKSFPALVPVFNGQIFKRVDTSAWPPGLVNYVTAYAYSGKALPNGAYKALEQQWILEGRPYDNLKTWLDSQVVPGLLYGGQQ